MWKLLTLGILTVVVVSTTATEQSIAPMEENAGPIREAEEKRPMGTAPNGCRAEQFQQCMRPMMNHAGNFSIGGPATWTADHLKQQCSAFQTVQTCVDAIVVDCTGPESKQWSALSDVLSYMCNEAFNETLKYAKCSETGQARTDLQMCIQALAKDQAAILHSENEDQKVQCGILEQYEQCVVEVEGEDCGAGARDLYSRIFGKLNAALNLGTICDGGDPEEPGMEVDPAMQQCEQTVRACLTRMDSHRQAVVNFDFEDLPGICKDFAAVADCVEASNCESTAEWEQIKAPFGYMCDQKTLAVIQNASQCFGKPVVVRKLDECETDELSKDTEMENGRTCQIITEFVGCIDKTIEDECDSTTSDAIDKVLEGVTDIIRLEKSVDCETEEEIVDVDEPQAEDEPKMEVDEKRCEMVIAECLQPLEPHRTAFAKFRVETIPQICSDFEAVVQCMTGTAGHCEETPEWDIIDRAFQQICEPETIDGITPCIGRKDVVTKLQSCEKEELVADVKVSDDKTCQVLEEYVDCYSVTVEKECEVKAGELISQVMSGVAQVIQLDKEVECEEVKDDDDEDDDDEDGIDGDDDDDEMDRSDTVPEDEMWGELKSCLGPLTDMHFSALPVHKFPSLDDLCNQAEQAKQCIKGLEENLDEEKGYNLDRLMAGIEYICEEKREGFSKIYGCIATAFTYQNGMDICYERQTGEASERMCRMIKGYEECVVVQATNRCGEEAGELFEGLMEEMDDLLAKEYHFDCPFIGEYDDTQEATYEENTQMLTRKEKLLVGFGVGLGVPVVIIAVMVVVAVCRRKRGSHSLQDKKALVRNEVLQSNVQVALSAESGKDTGIKSLSVSNLKV